MMDDKIVSAAIASTMQSFFNGTNKNTILRPNKLRKIICQQKLPGTSWTQFAACLEHVLEEDTETEKYKTPSVKTDLNGNIVLKENSICKTSKEESQSTITEGVNATESSILRVSSNVLSKNVKVPRAVAIHLTKKGNRKKQNIEINTKTKLTLHGLGDHRIENDQERLEELVTIQIVHPKLSTTDTGTTGSTTSDTTEKEQQHDLANKHIKAAELLLQNMTNSFRKFPERFVPRKAGGTLEEQEQEQQERLKRAEAEITKKHKKQSRQEDLHVSHNKKRKKEKFY